MGGHRAARALATILVVDDLPVNLVLKRSIFEPLGYAVMTAGSMADALSLARTAVPDLIISDVHMADGSGFDFIRTVKDDPRLARIPFVFVTSTYVDSAARAKGLALGAVRYLFRPLDPPALLAELDEFLPRDYHP